MTETDTEIGLRLERQFDAPSERVFDAWTDPQVLKQWWAAGPDWSTPLAEVDLRVGGRYRMSMRDPQNDATHTVGGEYKEIDRPARLVYTWAWERMDGAELDGEESIVEVEFKSQDAGTLVVVTHRGFASEESRANHEHGWNACLDNLAGRVFA